MATPKKRKRVYDPSKRRTQAKKKSPQKYGPKGNPYRKIDTRPPLDGDYRIPPEKVLVEYKVGAPTLYRFEFCEPLIEHLAEGFTFESFGACVAVGRATLYRWLEAYEEFRDAKTVGEELARYYWEHLAKRNAAFNVGNFQAIRFNMLNRFRDTWTDGHQLDITTRGKEISTPVNLGQLDTATLRKLLAGEDNES